jgi:hypothetical protein
MKRHPLFYISVLGLGGLIASCNNNKPVEGPMTPAPVKPELMEPFRFHKLVEVSPGQDFDVVSWGRGADKTGAFAILHSDSAAAKYTTTTGDLQGSIVDVYNTDMDLDGNPEIIIQAKGIDTNNYTNVYAFEFSSSKADKLDFPRLTKTQRQGYRGRDNFYVQDGKLYREFPLFGADAKPSGQKRLLEYGLRDNSFTVKQVSKDSTQAIPSAKPVPSSTQEEKPKPKKHKEQEETHHKKKHHHHHSDE